MSRTVPLQTAQKSNPANQQKRRMWLGFCIGLLIIFLVLSFLIGRAKPASTIQIADNDNLSIYEKSALTHLVNTMGEHQFYYANLDDIKRQILDLSWVDAVSVVRDWERGGIVVDVRPKKAVANFGKGKLLDANGVVFSPANQQALTAQKLVSLHGNEKEAPMLMQQTQKVNEWFSPLGMFAKKVILTNRHTWLFIFNTGGNDSTDLQVLVDYDRVDEKLYTLSRVLADKKTSLPLSRIKTIDLRYKNGFSVAYKGGQG